MPLRRATVISTVDPRFEELIDGLLVALTDWFTARAENERTDAETSRYYMQMQKDQIKQDCEEKTAESAIA